ERRMSLALLARRDAKPLGQPPLGLARSGLRVDHPEVDLPNRGAALEKIDLARVDLPRLVQVWVRVRRVGPDLEPGRRVVLAVDGQCVLHLRPPRARAPRPK